MRRHGEVCSIHVALCAKKKMMMRFCDGTAEVFMACDLGVIMDLNLFAPSLIVNNSKSKSV